LLIVAIGLLWIERRPIAVHYLKQEFERRGVDASYHLDRVGLRTQEVSNLVIGNPKHPDVVARHAIIQMRLKWDGSFKVYRVVARGVRLRGRLIHGKVSWGQIDKLMPPPSKKPFALPDFVLDVADSSISLATPFGPIGLALEGNGKLSGGFKGHAALASPRLVPGRCAALNLRANVALAVVARRPENRRARHHRPVHLPGEQIRCRRLRASMPMRASTKLSLTSTAVDGWRSRS
jgi:hypothetical protein